MWKTKKTRYSTRAPFALLERRQFPSHFLSNAWHTVYRFCCTYNSAYDSNQVFDFHQVNEIKCSYNSDSVELYALKSSLKCLETKGKFHALSPINKIQRQPYSPKDECQLINFPAILLHKSKIIQNISWLIAELLLHSIKLCFIFFFCFCFAWITTHVSNNFLLSFNFEECKLVFASHLHVIKQTVDFSIDLDPWHRLYQEKIKIKLIN